MVAQEQMVAQVETWWFRRTCVGSRSRLGVSDSETKDIPKNKLISVFTLDYFVPLN